MNVENVMQLVSNYIFPVVACIALAWYFAKSNEQYRQDIKELNATHKEETKQLSEAIDNNTKVIQRLLDKMEDK
jgi:Mg2+/citrate symporter